MVKKSRSPLTMADGTVVRNLEQLREHFDLESVVDAYMSGKLLTWLQNRNCDSEAELVENLDNTATDLQQKLCEILGVEYTGESADLGEIADRQERLARLRTFTDDAECIARVDQVAFDQEELADLLDDEEMTIYLCGEKFTVPASRKGITYIGVNAPSVHINGKLPESKDDLDIEFTNCDVDNLPALKTEPVLKTDENVDIRYTADITEGFADDIAKLFPRYEYFETENYIVTACYVDYFFRIDKRTHEIVQVSARKGETIFPRFDTLLSYEADSSSKFAISGDVLFYCGFDGIYRFDVAALAFPQKVSPAKCENISLNGDVLLFVHDGVGLSQYNVKTQKCTILVSGINCRNMGSLRGGAVFATQNGVFFTYNDPDPDAIGVVVAFYDYCAQKDTILYKSYSEKINHIYYADDKKLVVGYPRKKSFRSELHLGIIRYADMITTAPQAEHPSEIEGIWAPMRTPLKTVLNVIHSDEIETPFDVWYPPVDIQNSEKIYAYSDCLLFVANNGIVKCANYITEEITALAQNAINAADWTKKTGPAKLHRLGEWAFFEEGGSSETDVSKMYHRYTRLLYKVSLNQPNQIEMLQTYEDSIGFPEQTERGRRMKEIREVNLKAI